MNTPFFQIIYPAELDSTASYYANLLELYRQPVSSPYISHNKKFSIILHNRSTLSNAMVSPTPMHADFYTMADQNTYPQLWEKQLVLHEYRHVAQIQKINSGFTKGLYYLFGEQAVGAVMGLFVPFWFVEGDAVLCESWLSKSGRGRSPDFTMDLKAQLVDKKCYSYDKAVHGSYKHQVPDHYTLGYVLVRKGVEDHGMEIWNSTLENVAKRPYTLMPFSGGIKNFAGTGKVGFYKEQIRQLQLDSKRADKTKKEPGEYILVKPATSFTSYRFPNLLSNGDIVCEKTGIDDVNRFVLIHPDGSEERLFTPGFDYTESLSANDSLLCWNEKVFDIRWSNRDYSVIKLYNFKTKKLRLLSSKSRLFAPALSPDGSFVVAVHSDIDGTYSLAILSTMDGAMVKKLKLPNHLFPISPKWSPDGQSIISVVLGEQGKSLMLTSTRNWEHHFPLSFQFTEIKNPLFFNDSLLFIGSYNGTSNLYLSRLGETELKQLTHVRFGVNDPFITKEGDILFADYTADGYRIVKTSLDKLLCDSLGAVQWDDRYSYPIDKMITKRNHTVDEVAVPDSVYPVKKYSKAGHLFNLHSWGLSAVDLDNYALAPGLSLLSQTLLSTAVSTLGYYYDLNEERGKVKFGFEYLGWFPSLNFTASYAGRRSWVEEANHDLTEILWHETDFSIHMGIPLQFIKSKWVRGLRPEIGATQKFLTLDPGTSDSIQLKHDRFSILSYGLNAYIFYKKSTRSIFPKWGLYFNAAYRHTLLASRLDWQTGISTQLFVPGIMPHQGLRLYAAYEQNDTDDYSFSKLIAMPRGYSMIAADEMLSLKADYVLPLMYPDLDIPAVLYLKRVYAQLYYDMLFKDFSQLQSLASAGVELYTDWHFLSLLPEFRLGLRMGHRFDDGRQYVEFLFGLTY